jgi:hypothetical protein
LAALEIDRRDGEFQMRTVSAILGSLAALAIMTAPALARNSNAQQTDDKSAPSPCHSRQQSPDGTWIEIPCQELGGSSVSTPPRPAGRSAETASH